MYSGLKMSYSIMNKNLIEYLGINISIQVSSESNAIGYFSSLFNFCSMTINELMFW